jgi:hypothetical protein
MTQKDTQKHPTNSIKPPAKPNDTGSISVEGFVKIFDPKSKEVFVEKRA